MNPWIRWREHDVQTEPAWRWLAEWVGMPALLATPPRPLAERGEPASHLSKTTLEKFTALIGAERMRQDLASRANHAGSGTADRLRLRMGDFSRLPDGVLYPRNPDEVLALLKLAADAGVAVMPWGSGSGFGSLPERQGQGALIVFDLCAMSHVMSVDSMSGLARAEAGITAEELARQLAAQGMMLKGRMQASLGGHIARNRQIGWLEAVRLATPQGMVASALALALAPGSQGRLGIVTSASLRIQALPAKTEYRRYLFADFAGGLAALREAQRQGLARAGAFLSDAGETGFLHQMDQVGRERTLVQRLGDLYRRMRQFDRNAAGLTIGFCGSQAETDAARKRFDALARRLGALALGAGVLQVHDHRDMLLDRGLAMDRIETIATWSKLPGVYAAMRASLDRAMRAGAPRPGAHGLIMARVGDASHEDAKLRLTMIYPRMLGSDVAQAEAVRAAALNALAELEEPDEPFEQNLKACIKRTLDPKTILNPGKF